MVHRFTVTFTNREPVSISDLVSLNYERCNQPVISQITWWWSSPLCYEVKPLMPDLISDCVSLSVFSDGYWRKIGNPDWPQHRLQRSIVEVQRANLPNNNKQQFQTMLTFSVSRSIGGDRMLESVTTLPSEFVPLVWFKSRGHMQEWYVMWIYFSSGIHKRRNICPSSQKSAVSGMHPVHQSQLGATWRAAM